MCCAVASCGDASDARTVDSQPRANQAARLAATQRIDNVLLVVADTFRADRIGAYGAERDLTPNIDALAASGTLWTQNRSQGPWTVPSMISLMTGLYVTRHTRALPTDRGTIAELVAEAGVTTAAFVGNPVAGVHRGFQRGFDHYEESADGNTDALHFSRAFVDWHETRAEQDQRWFAWIQFMDTHGPYRPEPAFDRWRDTDDFPDSSELVPRWRTAQGAVDVRAAREGWNVAGADAAIERMAELRNRYDGEVATVDAAMGHLLEHLERTDQLENTLVVFASDHGEMLFEYPHHPQDLERLIAMKSGLPLGLQDRFRRGHQAWFEPEVWRTPLIMAGPRIEVGARRDALSANLDIAPTILEALGAEVPPDLDGRSKFPRPGGRGERDAVFGFGLETTAVLLASGIQLVEHPRGRLGNGRPGAGRHEVFDHGRGERFLVDLVASEGFDATALRRRLERWRAEAALTPNLQLDERGREIMRALGYIDTPDGVGTGR